MATTTISFNRDDPKDCNRALVEMAYTIWASHGPAKARQLFSKTTLSRKFVGEANNIQLMAMYVANRRLFGISVKHFAAFIAKINGELPRDSRYGPRGSTNPETLEKQIRREKKRAAKDPSYRKRIESFAEMQLRRGAEVSRKSSTK
jgi:hypothetical protein